VAKKSDKPEGPVEKADADPFIDHLKDAFVDAALAKDDDKELQEAKQRFGITDRGSAAWAAGKLAEAMNEIERRKKQVSAYLLDAQRRLERLEWMFKEPLREWARSNLDYGKRSVRLPTATLSFRDVPAKLEVVDEDALKKWAIVECPDAITTVEKLLMDPLKDFWTKNSMVPPGAKEIPAGESFSIKG
jgi:hypothetical protein